jgi:NAD-dependent DNA ligase
MPWLKEIRSIFFKTSVPMAQLSSIQPAIRGARPASGGHRQVDELIGLVKGVIADGSIHQSEVEFLLQWLESNKGSLDKWPAKAIYPRLKSALSDGNLDETEEAEIHELLVATLGDSEAMAEAKTGRQGGIPYTLPPPDIEFTNRSFCFTGRFQSGSRSWCVSQIIARGGMSTSKINRKLHYLVVGEIGDGDWFHSKHGRKIVRTLKYIETGANIAILSEQHWFEQLRRNKSS